MQETSVLKTNDWRNVCSFFRQAVPHLHASCAPKTASIKSATSKTKHSSFEESYPLKSEQRAPKITKLQAQYDRCTRLIAHSFTAQQCAHQCALKSLWIWGKIRNIWWWDGCEGMLKRRSWDIIRRKTKRQDVWKTNPDVSCNQKMRNISRGCSYSENSTHILGYWGVYRRYW